MSSELPTTLMREGFALIATVGGPYIGALMLVGLVVGVFQAATQINDPAVGFLPRLVAGVALAWLLGAWTLDHLSHFFTTALERMAQR